MKAYLLPVLLFGMFMPAWAQEEEDMLKQLGEDEPKKEYVFNAFKSSRVIMSHSMEMLRPGVLDFRILHRFGRFNGGVQELFGLDGPATVRLGLDYGITNFLSIGVGRSTVNKELDGFIKLRPIQQATGPRSSPVSVVVTGGSTLFTTKWSDPARENFFSSRIAYYGQLIIGRKFSEGVTLQVMPTMVHLNMVPLKNDNNDIYAAGIGGRIKLSKRISINADYYYVVNQNTSTPAKNPLSIGFDIETGGHVFQLHFTNAKGMNEKAFLTQTEYDWGKGDIMFGFNISRAFQIGKKKR
ncbi:MAG TPA: DUF5777 family beta-barrel protein [Flavisolibacter sp.]